MKNSNALEMLFDSYLSPADQIANRKLGRIASEIEMWRVQHNMTQRNFAKFMGVSQVMVSKWESGEYNFSIKTLANLASHLNCSFDGMFELEQYEKETAHTSLHYNNMMVPAETSFQYDKDRSSVPPRDLEYHLVTQGA